MAANRLEGELQGELESPWAARAEDVRRALGRPESGEVARAGDVIFCRDDIVGHIGQIRDIEQIKDLADDIELFQ